MKKQIIVSVDPFDPKPHVTGYAIAVARQFDLPLLLYSVHRYPAVPVVPEAGAQPVTYYPAPPEWVQDLEETGKAYCEEVKKLYPATRFEYNLGFLADELVSKVEQMQDPASEYQPFCIIMPKSHEHNWWNDVVGTTETSVAANAPCPVLFVPEKVAFEGVSRLMYLADPENYKNFDYPGFRFLEIFAAAFDAALVIAFLANDMEAKPKFELGELMDKIKRSLPFHTKQEFRFFPDFTPEDILKIVRLTHTDILAFPFKESNILERFFNNEITRTLLLKTDAPVLVF
jgi:nucleotide-binding universal stress UspA family protein